MFYKYYLTENLSKYAILAEKHCKFKLYEVALTILAFSPPHLQIQVKLQQPSARSLLFQHHHNFLSLHLLPALPVKLKLIMSTVIEQQPKKCKCFFI